MGSASSVVSSEIACPRRRHAEIAADADAEDEGQGSAGRRISSKHV
jgi:hypothetical protein